MSKKTEQIERINQRTRKMKGLSESKLSFSQINAADRIRKEKEMSKKTECKPSCPIQAGHCYCQDPKVTPEDRKKLAAQVKKHRG